MREARARSLTKSITWRVIGTLNLMVVSFIYTNSYIFSANIGVIDLVSNIILYFIHERLWNMTDWGQLSIDNLFAETRRRSISKAITWRVLASSYLVLISYLISNQIITSLGIMAIDTIANIIEYYLHERVWDKIEWGKNEYIFESYFKKIFNR